MSPRWRNSTTAMSSAENTTMRSPGRLRPEDEEVQRAVQEAGSSIRIVTPMDAITEL